MPTPPVTALDAVIGSCLTDFNATRTLALGLTVADAILITENPGLVSDPVLGPGAPSLAALNFDWMHFFRCNFETAGVSKILIVQQSLDRRRAEETVRRGRLFVNVQDPVFFG